MRVVSAPAPLCLPSLLLLFAVAGYSFAAREPPDTEPAATTAATAAKESSPPRRDGLRLSGRVAYLYGPVHGRLQTPTGGKPGTTTEGRPTLRELGFETASMPDLSLDADWGDHRVYAGYRFMRFSGASVLDKPLTSQGHDFAAATRVNADVTLDWARAGYGRRFVVDFPGESLPDLTLYPTAGAALWFFDYRLDQPGGEDVHRSYVLPAPQLGLSAQWPLTRRLTLSGEALASLPVLSVPRIYSGQLTARYHLFDLGRADVNAELGVGYDRIDYDDSRKQQVPNRISIDAGPMLVAGLRVRF
jgi:hypothetical protein